ncbi:hypothetical protein SAMN04489759_10876 [Sulfitobacter delicatus]|uniref:Uncharacterized protein n=2 Tax=Sulfitobacter delicatus TaxID=218672 RepID=A0A1G7UQM1_9RHOB|nr:hypothetical protein SAMN04489759_10876 [Sulfitobacter delicatus]
MTALIELVSEKLSGMSGNPQEIWRHAVSIGSQELEKRITNQTSIESDNKLRTELIDFLLQLADSFGISVEKPEEYAGYDAQLHDLVRYAGKLRAKELADNIRDKHVRLLTDKGLSEEGRQNALALSAELRVEVGRLILPSRQKELLFRNLNEFDSLILNDSANLANILKTLTFIGAAIVGTTGVLAAAPEALNTVGKITALIGYESASEEQRKQLNVDKPVLRLPPPQISSAQ